MKKMRVIFFGILILTLVFGIIWHNGNKIGMTEHSEFLFDTVCTITVYQSKADTAVDRAFDEIAKIHRITNLFDDSSDVSKINRAKKGEKITVDPIVVEIINIAEKVKYMSRNAFDIKIAPVSEMWKFDEDKAIPPSDEQIKTALLSVKNGGIEVDLENMTVTKLTDDTRIDLGGVAKGYAGDVAVRTLKALGISSGIIDFGGNIICFGKNPKTKDGKWRIGVQEPFKPTGDYEDTLEIIDGAVATSGVYQRYFEWGGKMYHHIIDPDTGYPADREYKSVTVRAENSALADCLATAIFVMGKDEGKALAEKFNAEVFFK